VPYPPHGGVLQRGYNIIRELGRWSRVHLLAFVHPDVLPTPDTLEESRRVLGGLCETVEYFDLWPKRSPAHKAAALAGGLLSTVPFSVVAHGSAGFRTSVQRAIGGSRFDVIHVDTIALTPFVDLGPARPAPTVLTHHNIESQLMERRSEVEARRLARWFLAREARKLAAYESAVSPAYDVNIFMSAQDQALLERRVPGVRGAVVPNGVDVAYFTPDGSEPEPSLIYTGGMNMFANRDAVVFFLEEIWPAVAAAVPQARFYAVGQDPPREVEAMAARDPRVVVTGYVDDIRPYVRRAAVYVVPLRVGGGTRLKVLDAMASGKAIVSTSIGCEGLDVTPGAHLLVADSPEEFVRTTVTLLTDRARQRALGDAARARVEERYAWPVVGTQLRRAYEAAIARRAGEASAVAGTARR
jgi:sugar transferase (PEP-CTERM/EpsH1 system associated)